MARSTTSRRRLAIVVHAGRIVLVVALMLAIPAPDHQPHALHRTNSGVEKGDGWPLDSGLIADIFGADATVESTADANGLWSVNDPSGQLIGKVARTLPIAKDVVGYRGPTETLIAMNQDLVILRVALLNSADTSEHVDAVVGDETFFHQFRGWPWGGPPSDFKVDAVSGATLTSLALAEGVLKRIGGDRPSLIFPSDFTAEEETQWLADAAATDRLIRTGPLCDDIAGYQGPTELILQVDENDRVNRIRLRSSYDNEPYVDYVRTESGFWAIFEGKTIRELAAFDPVAQRVEGVSGATMTSLAVADTLVAAAKTAIDLDTQTDRETVATFDLNVRASAADWATIGTLALLAIASSMGWFRRQSLRRIWLSCVTLVVGFWSGNLVSMALVAGWGAAGIAWRLAPGLAAIVIAAMVVPVVSKGNPYCNHLCPHGAIQQLIRPTSCSRRRFHMTARFNRILKWIPGTMLSIAYIMLILRPAIDLSSWEPFHAYLFRMAGWGSIALAIGSLALASVVPMGYCRFGCPTGRLLDYLRRNSTSHRILLADYVAIGLLLTALVAKSW